MHTKYTCPLCHGRGTIDAAEDIDRATTVRIARREADAIRAATNSRPSVPDTFPPNEVSTMPSGSWTIGHLERVRWNRRRIALIAAGALAFFAIGFLVVWLIV